MKKGLLIVLLALCLLQITLVSAIDIEVKKETIISTAIIEIDRPAEFELELTNNEAEDTFEIYSLVGIRLEPDEPFTIPANTTKKINLKVYPKPTSEFYSFQYKIKNSAGEIQEEELVVSIINLEDCFNFYLDSISPESDAASLTFESKVDHDFDNVQVKFSSVFFEKQMGFPLNAKEKKPLDIVIDKEKAGDIIAGSYIVTADITVGNASTSLDSTIKFTEKLGVDTTRSSEGFLLHRYEVEKRNLGNVPTTVNITVNKNPLSVMFTNFNIPYTRKEARGLNIKYVFQKNLSPGENMKVIARTNWWIFILIIIGAALVAYFAKKYSYSKLKIKKKAVHVKTKGGEFALKVSIMIKAKGYVENIKVLDKLPGMVKLYERYGTISPDRVDEKNRRLEWNVGSLDDGEERIFSYIIYSKIGIIGKFELPPATGTYEYQGNIREANSNKAFFVNEPKTD